MMQVTVALLVVLASLVAEAGAPMAKPGCRDTCGNVSIPFPFGIGVGCFLNPSFEIDCKAPPPNSSATTKPLLSRLGIEVLLMDFNYSSAHFEKYLAVLIPPTNSCTTTAHSQLHDSIDLRGSPYQLTARNVFVVEGCPGSGAMVSRSGQVLGGCETTCSGTSVSENSCSGVRCCHVQPAFDRYLQFYQVEFGSQSQKTCLLASLVNFHDYKGLRKPSTSQLSSAVPAQLSWVWSDYTFNRSSHSTCEFVYTGETPYENRPYNGDEVSCRCNNGYEGNPYFTDGCQLPQVCKGCPGKCIAEDNRFKCYSEERIKKPLVTPAAILGLGIGSSIALSVTGLYGLYHFVKRRIETKRRSKFFKHNGGLLLQQQVSPKEGVVERTKVFTSSELDKATDHFSESRILGQGGQGVVYKGMLSDGKIVAIKKSKLVDRSQLKQFINELGDYFVSDQPQKCS